MPVGVSLHRLVDGIRSSSVVDARLPCSLVSVYKVISILPTPHRLLKSIQLRTCSGSICRRLNLLLTIQTYVGDVPSALTSCVELYVSAGQPSMLPSNVTFHSTKAVLVDARFCIAKPPIVAVFSANTVLTISSAPMLKRAPPVSSAKSVGIPQEIDVGKFSWDVTCFHARGAIAHNFNI